MVCARGEYGLIYHQMLPVHICPSFDTFQDFFLGLGKQDLMLSALLFPQD